MAPSRANQASAAGRIALVGAGSFEGVRARHALGTMQVPGSDVDLFGAGEALLSEYDGEARLIQEVDRAAFEGYRLILICDTSGEAVGFLSDPSPGATTIDLTGVGYRDLGLPLAHDRFLPPVVPGAGSALTVPHSLSLVLAEILAPLHEGPGVVAVSAVILRPAADFGADAVDELRQQTVQLLNFGSPPVENLGRQLAFNVVPEPYLSDGGSMVSDRIESELARLLGLEPPAIGVDMVVMPVFYGHGISMQVTTGEPVSPEALYALLDAGPGLRAVADDRECTPVDVNGRGGVSITGIRADTGEGNRIRLWAAADVADSGSAVQAIRLARQLGVL